MKTAPERSDSCTVGIPVPHWQSKACGSFPSAHNYSEATLCSFPASFLAGRRERTENHLSLKRNQNLRPFCPSRIASKISWHSFLPQWTLSVSVQILSGASFSFAAPPRWRMLLPGATQDCTALTESPVPRAAGAQEGLVKRRAICSPFNSSEGNNDRAVSVEAQTVNRIVCSRGTKGTDLELVLFRIPCNSAILAHSPAPG